MEISLDDAWSIGGKPHGGYLLRSLVAPLLTEEHPHPLAVSAHFLRSPDPGLASVETETLRSGRRVSQHRSRLVQNGACVEALVSTGMLAADAEPFWSRTGPPEMPPIEECVRGTVEPIPGFRIGHLAFVDVRSDPAHFGIGPTLSEGLVRAYVQMADAPTTVLDLVLLADALPPVPLAMGLPGWVPTVELTVLVRAIPAPGVLIAEQRARVMQDGWIDEDCDIWDSRGRLVCQARQLAGFRAPA